MDCFKRPHLNKNNNCFGDLFYIDMNPEGYLVIGSIDIRTAQFELDSAGSPRELQWRYERHPRRVEGHDTKKCQCKVFTV